MAIIGVRLKYLLVPKQVTVTNHAQEAMGKSDGSESSLEGWEVEAGTECAFVVFTVIGSPQRHPNIITINTSPPPTRIPISPFSTVP